ncbi:MAG: glycosyltransferase family 4 protein [Candidatus Omnitrophica bacterium]|nr:glycosyltransferase family 4 protein [Candidatus Omnitrophota bacterium]
MRIGFDARMIDHPGIGRYIASLFPEMVKQAPNDEFTLLGDPEKLFGLEKNGNITVREWKAPVFSIQEQISGAFKLRDLDVLHVPNFNIPLMFKGKMVVTVHDLIYLLFPGSLPSALAGHYARFMIGSVLRRANSVIAVSAHTAGDLVKNFGSKYSDKITVILEATSGEFSHLPGREKIENVKRRFRLPDKFILYVGSIKPHKNVATLIKVFERVKARGLSHQLVICGRWDKKEDHLKDSIRDNSIKYIGEMPTEDLAVLYHMADILVHLSLYEGFGLTVLEAMRCGTPVVASDASSLPEVAGGAAAIVSLDDIRHITDKVYNVLTDESLRLAMIKAGLEHVKRFSWEKAARETLEVYRKKVRG